MSPETRKPTSAAETPSEIATPKPPPEIGDRRDSRNLRNAARMSPITRKRSAKSPNTPIVAATWTYTLWR